MELIDYRTPGGRRCTTTGTGRDRTIVIDLHSATVTSYQLYRDGGTEVYETDRGTLIFPRKIGIADRVPRLDGEPLTRDGRLPWEWVERRRMEAQTRRRLREREQPPAPKPEPVTREPEPPRKLTSPPLFARSGPHDPVKSHSVREELLAAQAKRDAWSPERELANRPSLRAWWLSTDREVYAHLSDEQYRELCEYRDQLGDRR